MGTIVVGVDGSDPSEHAARYAADLAAKLGARLVLVHVVPSLAVPADIIGLGEQLLQANRVRGEALLDVLRNRLDRSGLQIDKRLRDSGSPAEILAEVAREEGAELVAVGAVGQGSVTRLLLGSAADRLSHISPVPVLIVR